MATARRTADPLSFLPAANACEELVPLSEQAFAATVLELPGGLAFEEWVGIGESLAGRERAVAWWIGDWWAYGGEHRYGERARVAAERRFDYGYLANLGWVARAVEPSRRRERLSFGHHQCVASLPPDQQDRWLEQAIEDKLSVRGLRAALKRGLVASPGSNDAPRLSSSARSMPGQVYELGPHRLACGDASDPAVCAALLGGKRASMIWTDPPYGVDYVGKTSDALRIENDCRAGLRELLVGAWRAAAAVLIASAPFYVAGPTGATAEEFLASFREAGWRYQQMLIWVKNRMVLGRQNYQLQHEAIYHGHGPGPNAGRMSAGRSGWYGGDDAVSVFDVASPQTSREHPTMKPVELIMPQLLNSSLPGQIVLDPFAGSGSTMIAAERTGRRAFMVELNPGYCDVIRERWHSFERDDLDAKTQNTAKRRETQARPGRRPLPALAGASR
ncbi:MAG: DNA methyltransferase [Gaiellaceae bacterium]